MYLFTRCVVCSAGTVRTSDDLWMFGRWCRWIASRGFINTHQRFIPPHKVFSKAAPHLHFKKHSHTWFEAYWPHYFPTHPAGECEILFVKGIDHAVLFRSRAELKTNNSRWMIKGNLLLGLLLQTPSFHLNWTPSLLVHWLFLKVVWCSIKAIYLGRAAAACKSDLTAQGARWCRNRLLSATCQMKLYANRKLSPLLMLQLLDHSKLRYLISFLFNLPLIFFPSFITKR